MQTFPTDYDAVPIQTFRHHAFIPEKPVVFEADPRFISATGPLPATKKWFEPVKGDRTRPVRKVLTEAMQPFGEIPFPYELEYPQSRAIYGETVENFIESLKSGAENYTPTLDAALGEFLETQLPPDYKSGSQIKQILRFRAPLALLNAAIKFNTAKAVNSNIMASIRKLYIGQLPVNHLPKELQADVPVPRIVKTAGKGDIYDSSVWLGLEPTYTPLHRDPNPNLFVQLCSSKVVRLLPPASGDQMFSTVQQYLGNKTGNSRVRGLEMMVGPEADFMFKAIWWDKEWAGTVPGSTIELEDELAALKATMQEATLDPGDALFIPKGWWHSVKSRFIDGRLNGSVNWWFR